NALDWYPVYIVGIDSDAPQPAFRLRSCGTDGSDRTREGFQLQFGRPGELDDDTSSVPAVTDGPASSGSRVLVGFVQWSRSLEKFTNSDDHDGDLRVRYVGVRAETVASPSGRLSLRTQLTAQAGKPAIVMSEAEDGATLQFGSLESSGALVPVFTVTAKGDVTATGTVSGAVKPDT